MYVIQSKKDIAMLIASISQAMCEQQKKTKQTTIRIILKKIQDSHTKLREV